MNDGQHTNGSASSEQQRSWMDRLGDALLREPQDRHQLINILRDAEGRNLLDADALEMIEGVLEVAQMRVRDVMLPRNQMITIDKEAQPEAFLPIMIESAHSRFPVIDGNKDEVAGILLAKDMLRYLVCKDQAFDIRELLRPVVFIPESKRLNVLLREFRASRNHMAVVVDEYGGVSGLITIEDVLEQIVGEIEDEHDIDEDLAIVKNNDDSYTIKAITEMEEFNEYFGVEWADDFDTIGGHVVNKHGSMPKRDDVIVVGNFSFTVLRSDKRRVHLLHATLINAVEKPTEKPTETNSAEYTGGIS